MSSLEISSSILALLKLNELLSRQSTSEPGGALPPPGTFNGYRTEGRKVLGISSAANPPSLSPDTLTSLEDIDIRTRNHLLSRMVSMQPPGKTSMTWDDTPDSVLQLSNHNDDENNPARHHPKAVDRCFSEPATSFLSSSGSDDGGPLSLKAAANLCRYKSELCRPYEEHGQCKYGDKCQFAHGRHELRSLIRHPKYKTDLCKTYHTTGLCPYGPRCHFIHNDEERLLSDANRQLIDQQRAQLAQLQLQERQQQQLSVQVRELQRRMSAVGSSSTAAAAGTDVLLSLSFAAAHQRTTTVPDYLPVNESSYQGSSSGNGSLPRIDRYNSTAESSPSSLLGDSPALSPDSCVYNSSGEDPVGTYSSMSAITSSSSQSLSKISTSCLPVQSQPSSSYTTYNNNFILRGGNNSGNLQSPVSTNFSNNTAVEEQHRAAALALLSKKLNGSQLSAQNVDALIGSFLSHSVSGQSELSRR